MEAISFFLGKYQTIQLKDDFLIQELIKIITTRTAITINRKQIKINNQWIYLKIKPIEKSEIVSHWPIISQDLQSTLPRQQVKLS